MSDQDIESFVKATFRSVWDLELLCYLRREPDRLRQPAEIVTELRASELVVSNSVAVLLAAGLIAVEPDGGVRFAPAAPDLERLCEETSLFYARSPDAVRRMIVTAANPGISAFADAFRLRKD